MPPSVSDDDDDKTEEEEEELEARSQNPFDVDPAAI